MTIERTFTKEEQLNELGVKIDDIFTITKVETEVVETQTIFSGTEIAEQIKVLEGEIKFLEDKIKPLQNKLNFLNSLK